MQVLSMPHFYHFDEPSRNLFWISLAELCGVSALKSINSCYLRLALSVANLFAIIRVARGRLAKMEA